MRLLFVFIVIIIFILFSTIFGQFTKTTIYYYYYYYYSYHHTIGTRITVVITRLIITFHRISLYGYQLLSYDTSSHALSVRESVKRRREDVFSAEPPKPVDIDWFNLQTYTNYQHRTRTVVLKNLKKNTLGQNN